MPRVQEFLRSFGPAWVVMIADVDAPSILTAATAGAAYGYGLAWFFLILVVPLFVVQEVSGRIGIATGKGLGEVIRTTYSRRTAVLASAPMALVDIVSYVAEYTGIAIGGELVGVPPVVSMPLAYVAHIMIIRKRSYVSIEKLLLAISTVLILSYAGSLVARGFTSSSVAYFSSDPSYLFLLAASAGAVVMPFMLFYQASATAEKGKVRLWAMRTETLIGAVASEIGMVVIMMATAGLGTSAGFASAAVLSQALSTVANSFAPYLFAVGPVGCGLPRPRRHIHGELLGGGRGHGVEEEQLLLGLRPRIAPCSGRPDHLSRPPFAGPRSHGGVRLRPGRPGAPHGQSRV